MPVISCVAIKFGELVCHLPPPNRHHNVLHTVSRLFKGRTDLGYLNECQGFLTDKGEFLNRQDAYKHAMAHGQVTCRRPGGYDGDELFSEDLW